MGADKAVHVLDEALHGSDAIQTAKVIAKALGTIEWDVAIAGSEATDSRMSVVPALVAEALGAPQLSLARKVTVDGSTITIERTTDTGYATVEASTPGRDQRRREDQRAALPVVQGHHGGQEQADHDPRAGLISASTPARSAWPTPGRRCRRSRTPRRARPGRPSRTKATAA